MVVIIGAGPAGCAAAIALRLRNVRCVVLEKGKQATTEGIDEPRQSLHPGVQVLLRHMGAEDAWTRALTGSYTGIWRNSSYRPLAPAGQSDWIGAHIRRSVFDRTLRDRADHLGAEMRYGAHVRELLRHADRVIGVRLADGTEMFADHVIDASGQQQLSARRMRFKLQKYSRPIVVSTGRAPKASRLADTAHFVAEEGSWSWWAVDSDGSATWTRLTSRGDIGTGHARSVVRADEQMRMGMQWRLARPLATEGLLLAGDAACVLDAASGHGIFRALEQGVLAAGAIGAIRNDEQPECWVLAQYDEQVRTAFEQSAEQLMSAYDALGIEVRPIGA